MEAVMYHVCACPLFKLVCFITFEYIHYFNHLCPFSDNSVISTLKSESNTGILIPLIIFTPADECETLSRSLPLRITCGRLCGADAFDFNTMGLFLNNIFGFVV
eukprot:274447_1